MGSTDQRPISVLAINQYYAPDVASSGQLLAELCEGLAERGMRVTVVAGQPSYVEGLEKAPEVENIRDVEVHRVPMGRLLGRRTLLRRGAGYSRFMLGAYRKARSVAKETRPDVVLTMSNPPSVGLIGGRVARASNAKFVYILFDLFPDIAIESGSAYARWPLVPLWRRMNRWVFSHADAIAVPGEAMKETLIGPLGIEEGRVSVIPNWPRPDLSRKYSGPNDIRQQLGIPEDCLLVLTAGNLGVMQELGPLVAAAGHLKDRKAGFLFLGSGVQKASLQERAARENLSNVWFLDFQPEDRFARIVDASDVCVVALKSAFNGLSVPSRTYTYMSAGKPVLAIMQPEDEIARLVRKYECGWAVTDGGQLVERLAELTESPETVTSAGENAARAAGSIFTKQNAVDRYYDLISKVVRAGAALPSNASR